jgi:adenosine/AMP kinase
LNLNTIKLEFPADCNIILGQTHFIKSVEDLYEIFVGSVPGIKFGIAFSEASGPCLVRKEGNDAELIACAVKNILALGSGHTFVSVLKNAYPINVLNAVKMCQEVCTVFCATANPVEVVVAQAEQGNGILGVIDGASPKGVELPEDVKHRKELLRKFHYKLD